MKFIVIAATVLHLTWAASIVDITCPDSCTCQPEREHLQTTCASYEFIKKLLPKQESTIVRLNINNASLINIDLKLKYLKNLHALDLSYNAIAALPSQFPYLPKLKSLDLSHNKLTSVDFAQLPKNLQKLDLSHNSIATFPKYWASLEHLKVLLVEGNPIDCDCDNLSVYQQLIKAGVTVDNPTCVTPIEFHGQHLDTVNCSLIKENLLNSMLGDDGGSGIEALENSNDSSIDDQSEFINAEGITDHPNDEAFEGSGDEEEEGSGLIPILPIPVKPKACHFNCSTPRPVGIDDENNAASLPSIKEQVNIVFEDIFQPEKVTTVTTPELSRKEVPLDLNEPGDKETHDSDVVTFPTNDTVIGEMERASFEGSSNNSVYIIVGLVIAFIAFLIVYYINKKKAQNKKANRKRNASNENGVGEEMKPLGKSAEAVKPELNSKPPEGAPLLNGQNGKLKDDNHVKSHDENDLEEVELRKVDRQDTLTPQPERVTIKAGELPDSIPKTPLFVHRQLNSDGEIVTTAVN